LADSPLKFADTGTALVPLPTDCDAVELPYAIVSPHSKYAVVDAPFGFADPLSAPPLEVILFAAVVVTVGFDPLVVKETSDP
jgi:hypothetical protein